MCVCDYEAWVYFISNYFGIKQIGSLKYDFMSHTNKIEIFVRIPENAAKFQLKSLMLYNYVTR